MYLIILTAIRENSQTIPVTITAIWGVLVHMDTATHRLDRKKAVVMYVSSRSITSIPGFSAETPSIPAMENTRIPASSRIYPVSYTHLDVYKRQVRTDPAVFAVFDLPAV